jgi:hypothetical protein
MRMNLILLIVFSGIAAGSFGQKGMKDCAGVMDPALSTRLPDYCLISAASVTENASFWMRSSPVRHISAVFQTIAGVFYCL